MYKGYRVSCVIPAGRKRTMSLLMDHLDANKDVVDEVQVWMNHDKKQKEDIAWCESLPEHYDYVKTKKLKAYITPKQLNTGSFYQFANDPKTIYIRFDDDIVYIDREYFKNLLDFRLKHPDYFLIFGNIINNAVTSYYQQKEGNVSKEHGEVEEPFCMDPVGWRSPKFARYLHETLLEKIGQDKVSDLYIGDYELGHKRFSVSNFCYFGKDMPEIESEEEMFLSSIYPKREGKCNAICGKALCSHYSFFAQKEHLNETDILDRYREIAKDFLSDSYYRLLDESNRNSA